MDPRCPRQPGDAIHPPEAGLAADADRGSHERIRVPCYDIAGNLLFQHSMDAGDRWMINDAAGQPFFAWDANDRAGDDGALVLEQRRYHTTYDELRRPREQQLSIDDRQGMSSRRFIYGEPWFERRRRSASEQRNDNLRGQVRAAL